jgi:hypothetical protein
MHHRIHNRRKIMARRTRRRQSARRAQLHGVALVDNLIYEQQWTKHDLRSDEARAGILVRLWEAISDLPLFKLKSITRHETWRSSTAIAIMNLEAGIRSFVQDLCDFFTPNSLREDVARIVAVLCFDKLALGIRRIT